MVPILSDAQMNDVDDFDKFVARSQAESDVLVIQTNLEKTAKKIEDELKDISKENFQSFFELCEKYENIPGKKCKSVIKKNVSALIREVRAYTKSMRDQLKEIRTELGKLKKGKQAKLEVISKKIKESVKAAVKYIANFEDIAINLALDKDFDYVICGHIHQPTIRQVNRNDKSIIYLNSGDWIENLTSLEYHNREWSLIHFEHDKINLSLEEEQLDFEVEASYKELFAAFSLELQQS
jgi:hypothetical protein